MVVVRVKGVAQIDDDELLTLGCEVVDLLNDVIQHLSIPAYPYIVIAHFQSVIVTSYPLAF